MQNPSACVPALARGLSATRKAINALRAEPDAVFILQVKEQQFMDAINTALGIDFQAIASVPGPVVPGQRVSVETSLTNRGSIDIQDQGMALVAAPGWETTGAAMFDAALRANATWRRTLTVTVPADAPVTRPYFERPSIAEPRYTLRDASQFGRPAAAPAVSARARYRVDGVQVEIGTIVRRREPHLPYGDELRELMVVPAVAVNVTPRVAVVPTGLRFAGAPAGRGARRAAEQPGEGRQRPADAAAAGRLDVDARGGAVHVRARRRARHVPVQRRRAVAREPRLPDRGGGHHRRPIVPRATTSSSTAISRRAISIIPRRRWCAAWMSRSRRG